MNKVNRHDESVGTYKEIDKLELHEITICEEGINPEAKFDIVKEDKNMSEIEKALAEFNEVMTELVLNYYSRMIPMRKFVWRNFVVWSLWTQCLTLRTR